MPGMASTYSRKSQPTAFQSAVFLNSLFGVMRAGRVEAAIAAQQQAETALVYVDECN